MSRSELTSTEPLRYGVIGTGMMGVEHIHNILALDGATVSAVADPHPTSLDWAQLAVGIDNELARFSTTAELVESELCDAVVIASPNHTHIDELRTVLASPLHVLVEKCCHFFDPMNQLTGSRPVRVFASGAQSVNHLSVAIGVAAHRSIESGMPVSIADLGRGQDMTG